MYIAKLIGIHNSKKIIEHKKMKLLYNIVVFLNVDLGRKLVLVNDNSFQFCASIVHMVWIIVGRFHA